MPNLSNDPNVHYVKFMRGSVSAWETLKLTPEKISDDTLYFIYQNAQTSTDGKLYLGQKLISGVGNGGSSTGDININDIGDVYIDGEELADKQILVYNDTSQHWENTSLSTIINTAVGIMQGATAQADGISGLVPVPRAGDQNKFLRGDGAWAPLNIPTFNSDVFSLDSNEVNLQGYDLAPIGSIPIKTNNGIEWSSSFVGTLNRQITTLEKLRNQLNGTDPEPIDYNTIYMVPNGNNSESSNKYDEYMVIGNVLELLGTFGEVNLNNYVTITTFNTAISSIENVLNDHENTETGEIDLGLISRVAAIENNYITKAQIGDLNTLLLSDGNTTLVEEVNTINERLKWHNLTEE